ncbi:DUF397 domain-containing protein [Saccharothrix coeruleofusca]|uniref:DUF397 domain-containing protein n=1 Tax=Saccharothrix coeruleofusca TaxID=33919 RepID=A0A918ALU9_9PSEU|nr:DUF397 domain-containing protein [Saccharothrix coeruleofusca]GGP54164.1 hypothetical protein GCM10010185_28220 [Saccharothrix coeruleofusca]
MIAEEVRRIETTMTRHWRKSSHSGPNTDCVEIAGSHTALRDSKNPVLKLTIGPAGLAVFLEAAKQGCFTR